MIHTGDITHLSKPDEFDNANQLISKAALDVHYVPGEHDFVDEGVGMAYLFPQPVPGTAPSPGPMTVPADQLRSVLGITSVSVRVGDKPLAITDGTRELI
jgi:hypothetical protein